MIESEKVWLRVVEKSHYIQSTLMIVQCNGKASDTVKQVRSISIKHKRVIGRKANDN